MLEDKFARHLQNLYEANRPDVAELPTGEQMLTGVLYPQGELTIDQQMHIIDELVEAYDIVVKIRPTSWHILLSTQTKRMLNAASVLQIELQQLLIMRIEELLRGYGNLYPRWREVLESADCPVKVIPPFEENVSNI